jgi:phosphatidylserine synthase
MVSRIRTPALGGIHIRPKLRLPLLAAIGISAGAAVDMPWVAFLVLGIAYLASIPVMAWRYKKRPPVTEPAPADTDPDI